MGDAALTLAALGWRVLLLDPDDGKAPFGRLVPRGVDNATTDPDLIRRWWSRYPHANIGARVPAGVAVVDIDPHHGGVETIDALQRHHGALPSTLTVWSGRGDGSRHLYYRRPDGQLRGKIGQGIDVKRDNSYLVMPPSIHPETGRPYRWERHPVADAPAWLARLMVQPIVTRPAVAPSISGTGEHLIRWVARQPKGNRNEGLFFAACRAVEQQLGDGVLDQLVAAAVFNGLTEVEARRTVASARRRAPVST
jgi:hypothetical protein